MIPRCLLTCVVYGCSVMANASSQRCPKSQAPQPGADFAASATPTIGGGPTARQDLFHLSSSGLSLHPAGAASDRPRSRQRSQGCLYRQTLTHSGRPHPDLCHGRGSFVKRERQSSLDGHAQSGTEAWLSSGQRAPLRSISNIALIAYSQTSSPMPINSWCRTGAGLSAPCRRFRMNKMAALYARVSSDRQKEEQTISSQTAALVQYAETHGYTVPPQWQFQDEGYSGASLLRPGLEAVRDLAAAGQIAAVLVHSPDRLSRKYAYQVLLAEEFSRDGVELVFLKAPSGATPEDQLLVQFQGMIAEYERAQIAERSRRGKRHRAHQGSINVLSGAPYGYRYVKKSDTAAAYYEVVESEAAVVRQVYEVYTQQGLSINAIARMLNERQVPTRTETTRWERSTVWGLLRNPAYRGRACYGKTELRPRQRITRPLRQRNGLASRDSANHERPRQDWIEIAVPALVSEETFALAQEQLEQNKQHSPRRTIEPTLLQGMLVCQCCGYGLYRTSFPCRSGYRLAPDAGRQFAPRCSARFTCFQCDHDRTAHVGGTRHPVPRRFALARRHWARRYHDRFALDEPLFCGRDPLRKRARGWLFIEAFLRLSSPCFPPRSSASVSPARG